MTEENSRRVDVHPAGGPITHPQAEKTCWRCGQSRDAHDRGAALAADNARLREALRRVDILITSYVTERHATTPDGIVLLGARDFSRAALAATEEKP